MSDHTDLAGFPVVITVPVQWGDQDSFGHVNNTVYLRWAESARIEYLRRVGLWQMLPDSGVGPILASITCDYDRPVTHPDVVRVGARVTRIGNSSFRMEHRVVSQELSETVARLDSTLVVIDYGVGRPITMPETVRKAVEALEGRLFESNGARRG